MRTAAISTQFDHILPAAGGVVHRRSGQGERRTAPRQQAALTAEVVSGGRRYQAQILTVSTGGLTLSFTTAPALYEGAQMLVNAPGLASISGSIRWIAANECGLAFNVALVEDMLHDAAILFDSGKRARPGRARVRLPTLARAPGIERRVVIENIGSGGALIRTGLSLPVDRGLTLEIEDASPIDGHIRWSRQGRCGMMFSALLPVSTARMIAERCSIHPSWLREGETAHSALTDQGADSPLPQNPDIAGLVAEL